MVDCLDDVYRHIVNPVKHKVNHLIFLRLAVVLKVFHINIDKYCESSIQLACAPKFFL